VFPHNQLGSLLACLRSPSRSTWKDRTTKSVVLTPMEHATRHSLSVGKHLQRSLVKSHNSPTQYTQRRIPSFVSGSQRSICFSRMLCSVDLLLQCALHHSLTARMLALLIRRCFHVIRLLVHAAKKACRDAASSPLQPPLFLLLLHRNVREEPNTQEAVSGPVPRLLRRDDKRRFGSSIDASLKSRLHAVERERVFFDTVVRTHIQSDHEVESTRGSGPGVVHHRRDHDENEDDECRSNSMNHNGRRSRKLRRRRQRL